MAVIVRRYDMPQTEAWYAQVLGDDGIQRELKIRSETEPTDADFLTLSAQIEAMEAALREPKFDVEAEDGQTIG